MSRAVIFVNEKIVMRYILFQWQTGQHDWNGSLSTGHNGNDSKEQLFKQTQKEIHFSQYYYRNHARQLKHNH